MKKHFLFLPVLMAAMLGCGNPSQETQNGASDADSDPNQVLYDQVMDIHDEVMPKTEDLHNLKKSLQEQIAATPDMVAEERQKLERRIARLDSVDKMMMDWMHYFNFSGQPDGRSQTRIPGIADGKNQAGPRSDP
jgi:hypothetical protein